MTQPDLSDARVRRDLGMERAQDKADRDVPAWSERAYRFLLDYAQGREPFLAEDAWIAAEAAGITPPEDRRAYGPIIMRAPREKTAPVRRGACEDVELFTQAAVGRRMIAMFLTLALQSCEHYARELQNGGTELYAYHDACIIAVDADMPGAYQVSSCIRHEDGRVVCDFHAYGDRRLPYQPMVAR